MLLSLYQTMRPLCIFFILLNLRLNAQQEPSVWKLHAIQADLGTGIYTPFKSTDQQRLQSFVQKDPYLYENLETYTSGNSYSIYGFYFEGIAGAKILFQKKEQKFKKEFYAGLRFTQNLVSAVSYVRSQQDTAGSFEDFSTGKVKYVIHTYKNIYNFTIRGDRLYFPVGAQISTNQSRFIWFSAALEVTPFLDYNHKFTSSRSFSIDENIVASGESPDPFGTNRSFYSSRHNQNIKGLGTGIFIGVPLSVYLHPLRKETNGLQRLHLFGSLMPLAVVVTNKFSGTSSVITLNASTGLRFDLL